MQRVTSGLNHKGFFFFFYWPGQVIKVIESRAGTELSFILRLLIVCVGKGLKKVQMTNIHDNAALAQTGPYTAPGHLAVLYEESYT